MLKNKTVLEVKKGERIYQLELYSDSPLGEVFDVLCEMQGFVIGKIKESQPEKKEENQDSKVQCIEQPKEE